MNTEFFVMCISPEFYKKYLENNTKPGLKIWNTFIYQMLFLYEMFVKYLTFKYCVYDS